MQIIDAKKELSRAPIQVVRPEGFEPPTLGSEDRCSNPLSYGRVGDYISSFHAHCQHIAMPKTRNTLLLIRSYWIPFQEKSSLQGRLLLLLPYQPSVTLLITRTSKRSTVSTFFKVRVITTVTIYESSRTFEKVQKTVQSFLLAARGGR